MEASQERRKQATAAYSKENKTAMTLFMLAASR
jgi:hypothetical protein